MVEEGNNPALTALGQEVFDAVAKWMDETGYKSNVPVPSKMDLLKKQLKMQKK